MEQKLIIKYLYQKKIKNGNKIRNEKKYEDTSEDDTLEDDKCSFSISHIT